MVLQPAPTLHGDPALTPLSAALSYKYREVQRWKIQNTFKLIENVNKQITATTSYIAAIVANNAAIEVNYIVNKVLCEVCLTRMT